MELFTPQRPILAKENDSPSSYMDGSCVNSLVADGCDIQGTVKNCVLFRGVRIEPGADVEAAFSSRAPWSAGMPSCGALSQTNTSPFRRGAPLWATRTTPW